LPVPYFHIVFSLPAQIADIAYQNKAAIYDILFKASAETLITIAADPKHLGARIGILSVLHTWGSGLTHHPHVSPHEGINPQFANGIVSSVAFVSTTNTARSLARFVLLALALTPWRSPGSSEKLCPAL
jgi:hypothetical protein